MESYLELRMQGETPEMAAIRVGVSWHTAEKYDTALRRTGRLRD